MKKKLYLGPVLVTGASSGIGAQTAIRLAEEGYKVYCASRSGKAPAENQNLIPIKMDVTDEQSIKDAKGKIPELQIIVHCAGFGIAGSCECVDISSARAQMETNFLGVLAVNNIFLPLLRKHAQSLVVVTGSVAGLIAIPFQSHYSCSKYALEAYTEALRMEGKRYGIKAVIIEPGDTHTGFTSGRKMVEPKDSPYLKTCQESVSRMEKDELNGKSPNTVASAILKMLKKRNPPIRAAVGFDYKCLVMLKHILPSRLTEKLLTAIYIPKEKT